MEILGEYVGLEGQRHQLRVSCEAPDDADPLQGLLSGVARMRELVAELLDPQVQRETQDRAAAAPEEALDERKGEGEGGRNINDERESPIGHLLHTPHWGLSPQPGHMPLPGTEPRTSGS
uniref:GON7 subunit of KEOPS complex n=1 Tax=Myotis myotis TaxID=51298 RepID=A0A7J8AKX6_MYOMY|nr:GON7 subunit of KEOPS complex [Myotis myotis]